MSKGFYTFISMCSVQYLERTHMIMITFSILGHYFKSTGYMESPHYLFERTNRKKEEKEEDKEEKEHTRTG